MIEYINIKFHLNKLFYYLDVILIEKIKINSLLENNNAILSLLLTFIINNLFLLDKLLIKINNKIYISNLNKKKYIKNINDLKYNILNKNNKILQIYNNYSINKSNSIIINLINKNLKPKDFNLNNNNNLDNLDTYNLENIDLLLDSSEKNKNDYIFSNDSNYLYYKYIDIGFKNSYKLHCYNKLKYNLPFNLLLYVLELNQVIIKIGDDKNYKYINSKLYPVYINNNINNKKSILCNNNIKELNKKCMIHDCSFYHDSILGYIDNSDNDRQFSYNPIVYNCINFKDGREVKENIQKIKWYNAITLYQSSLSNILIGCIHSLNN